MFKFLQALLKKFKKKDKDNDDFLNEIQGIIVFFDDDDLL